MPAPQGTAPVQCHSIEPPPWGSLGQNKPHLGAATSPLAALAYSVGATFDFIVEWKAWEVEIEAVTGSPTGHWLLCACSTLPGEAGAAIFP